MIIMQKPSAPLNAATADFILTPPIYLGRRATAIDPNHSAHHRRPNFIGAGH